MTQSEWHADFASRLMHNEGYRLRTYLDSMGIPTIGVGFNLDRDDWAKGLQAAGVPADQCGAVKAGSQPLTVEQVGKLLDYSDAPVIPQSRAELETTHFDAMSDARRAAFADLDFNLGQGGLDEFIGFRGLMNQACHLMAHGDPTGGHEYFVRAAADLLSTGYAQQVGARAQRNAAMISSSTYVAIDAFES